MNYPSSCTLNLQSFYYFAIAVSIDVVEVFELLNRPLRVDLLERFAAISRVTNVLGFVLQVRSAEDLTRLAAAGVYVD